MTWIIVPKPTETSILTGGGGDAQPWGMLIAITSVTASGSTIVSVISGWGVTPKPSSSTWTIGSKPTNSVWTVINKPTS